MIRNYSKFEYNFNLVSNYSIDLKLLFFVLAFSFFTQPSLFAQNELRNDAYRDSLIQRSADFRHSGDFESAESILAKAEKESANKIRVYTEWSLTLVEKADENYNASIQKPLSKKQRLKIFLKALQFARKALAIDSTDSNALEYISLSYASILSVGSLSQQAQLADSVRIYAEKMLMYEPNNDRALHILGRWHYEVANLGWFIPTLSKVFFGVSPEGSFDEAIRYFERSVQSNNNVVNNFWLAQSYLKQKNKSKAKETFLYLLQIPNDQHNDDFFKDQSRSILKKEFNIN